MKLKIQTIEKILRLLIFYKIKVAWKYLTYFNSNLEIKKIEIEAALKIHIVYV